MKIAMGKVKITPPDFLGGPIGRPMAGYTPISKVKSVKDDIYAHIVLIENTELENIQKRMILISMDIVLIPLLFSEYIKEKIEEKHNIHTNQILIHATHTHKSMDMAGTFSLGGSWPGVIKGIIVGAYQGDDKYKVWIALQIAKLVGNLIKKLRPAKIAWKKKELSDVVAFNRRKKEVSKQPMGIISFKDVETNNLLGIIVNFGAHPTTLGHRHNFLSAGFPGQLVKRLEDLLNLQGKVVFFNAAAGDVAPNYGLNGFRRLIKKDDGKLYRRPAYLFTIYYGSFLGNKAKEILDEIQEEDYFDTLYFKSYVKRFWVPMNDFKRHRTNLWTYINNRIVHIAKRYILFPLALAMGDWEEPNFPGFAVKHNKSESYFSTTINTYSIIQYFKLVATNAQNNKKKEWSIVSTPGELFLDLAYRIYNSTPEGSENTFIFQASNDWIAYLFPIEDYINSGGYEPLASYSPLCGMYVWLNFKKLMEDIEKDIIAGFY